MKHKLTFKIVVFSIFSGLSLAAPFTFFQAGWISFVSLIPLLYTLNNIQNQNISKTKIVFCIWLSGIVMMLVVLLWMLRINLDLLSGFNSRGEFAGLILAYLLSVLILSVGSCFFGYLLMRDNMRVAGYRAMLILPSIWVVSEWLRSWLYLAVAKGPNGSLGSYWNFGDMGFAASATPLVYLGRILGLYGLSFVVVAINVAIFYGLHKRWKPALYLAASLFAVGLVSYFGYVTPNGKPVQVGAMQLAAYPSKTIQADSEYYRQFTNELGRAQSLDILVLPEYSGVFGENTKNLDRAALLGASANNQVPIITSRTREVADHKRFNTLTVYNSAGDTIYQHDKQFLIPIGEAMPYIYDFLYRINGKDQAINTIENSREVSRSASADRPYLANELYIASVVCSGAIAPELYRTQVSSGAEILTNSASLILFENAPQYFQQTKQMSRFIAVSNARPFVQATKGGFSTILDQNGRIVSASQQKNTQMIEGDVITNKRRTPYSLLGEWTLALSLLIIARNMIKSAKTKTPLRKFNRDPHA